MMTESSERSMAWKQTRGFARPTWLDGCIPSLPLRVLYRRCGLISFPEHDLCLDLLVTVSRFLLVSDAVEFTEKARIMDEARINRALARLASEIVEENHGLTDLVLVGIRRRGVHLANRIADKIEDL